MTDSMEVSFRVNCTDTRIGQHVRVVGSCAALGGWRPSAGLPLHTSAGEFPIWSSADVAVAPPDGASPCVRLPVAEAFEYKYVICNDDGWPVRWEERPNRSAHLGALVARGVVRGTGRLFLTELFNSLNEPDGSRFFSCGSTALPPLTPRRSTKEPPGGKRAPSKSVMAEALGIIAPTVRERAPSLSLLGPILESGETGEADMPARRASRSYSRLPEPTEGETPSTNTEPEPESTAGASPLAEATTAPTTGHEPAAMMREESCSVLFADVYDDEEEIRQQEFGDRYELLGNGPLGEGTFGLVWRCTAARLATGEERAAKIVRKANLQPHDMRYLLGEDGEVKTHLTMKHSHIVELYEYFDEPSTVTLVLDFCRGGDLFDAIVRQKKSSGRGLAEQASAVVTRHVFSALQYMHGQRVVHRDIKCENVLLSKVGVPLEENIFKLCDFGFAAHDRGQGLCDRLGSPDTVAPEVVVGNRYGAPVDIWSTGVLIYMMLSATPPFYASSDGEVLRKVRAGSYSLKGGIWDSISVGPKNLIASVMTVDPRKRLTATEALKSEWLRPASTRNSA